MGRYGKSNSEIIQSKLISCHYNNPLAGYFEIDRTCKLIARKYYQLTLYQNVEAYVKECIVCLASETVRYKPYGNLQSLLVSTSHWKNLSINFVTGLSIPTDWKKDSYDAIFAIVKRFIKMVHHKLVKTTIDVAGLAEIIINVVVRYYSLPESIVGDENSLFTSKFWCLLYYFFGIKQKISTTFHLWTDDQTRRQNSTM